MPLLFVDFRVHLAIPAVRFRNIRVVQREFEHERVIATLQQLSAAEGRPSGSQMFLRWGEVPQRSERFYGYINHEEDDFAPDDEKMKVVCVGATFPCKQERTRAWSDTTLQRIVQEIARDHRFDSFVLGTDRVSSVVQQAETDWEFLARIAQERGKTFFARNTCLYVGARGDFFSRNLMHSPTFVYGNTLHQFEPRSGESLPDGGRRHTQVYGIGPDGDLFRVSEDKNNREMMGRREPLFEETKTVAVATREEAKQRIDGDGFVHRAHATTAGDAKVRPGKVISLRGVASRHEGFWYVLGAEHRLGPDDYTMELELARPEIVDQSRGLAPGLKVARTPGFDPHVPAPTRTLNGWWRAEWGS